MEEQQSTAEEGAQLLTTPNNHSMEGMPPVNPTTTSATTFVHASPPSVPLIKPRARNPSWKVGFQKLRILLWKNFLLRKRSWVLLLFHSLFYMLLMDIFVAYGPPSGTEAPKGPLNPNVTAQKDMVNRFQDSSHQKEIFYVANDQDGYGKKIIENIEARTSNQPATWKNANSEKQVEAEFDEAFAGTRRNGFWGAVIFEKVDANGVTYKIRKSDDASRSRFSAPFHTEAFFSSEDFLEKGPRRCDDPRNLSSCEEPYMKQYENEGILGLQILIDDAAIKTVLQNSEGLKRTITMKSFPYPQYKPKDTKKWAHEFCWPLILIFFMSNAFLAMRIGSEKETGVKELMKLCGYPGWMQTLSWYLSTFLFDLINLVVFVIYLRLRESGERKQERPVFGNSNITLLLFTLLLVMISNNAFVIFLCSLTKSTPLSTAVAILSPAFIILQTISVSLNQFPALMGISLLPHGCFVVAFEIIVAYEGDGRGAHWSMLADPVPNIPKLNLGLVILMFLVDITLYQSLAVYFEAVLPSDYGVQKPPHYPIKALIAAFKFRKKRGNIASSGETANPMESEAFETPTDINKSVGVDVRNLVKEFGTNMVAVNGVSFKMYHGEIFALLGHNGAGKTTLISMLTGLFAPTSGTAIIDGYGIKTDLDMVRLSMGLCPQHDMLFSNLTVMEHLKIFGQMKGQSSHQAKQEALALLQKMNLADKENVVSKKLSGGQKRKLCLAMALIGGAKVVILDEPTSGMDPEARRKIWDILLDERGKRTILLTTHHMEEADALGDRIGIMATGQLQCYGSLSFLKSFYKLGYTLKMSLLPGADKSKILALVQEHISNAALKSTNMPSEAFFSLPMETGSSSVLAPLFSALTEKKDEMCIESIGLSVGSMDEIFVKVGEILAVESEQVHHSTKSPTSKSSIYTKKEVQDDSSQMPLESATISQVSTVSHGEGDEVKSFRSAASPRKIHGLMLIPAQAIALILKRFICTKRKIFHSLFQVLIPALLMLGAVLFVNYHIHPGSVPPPLAMRFKDYKNSRTLYSDLQNPIPNGKDAIKESEVKPVNDIKKEFEDAAKSDIIFFREKIIVGGEVVSEDDYTAWYNEIPLHAAPLAINLASNIRARELHPSFTIRMINHPLQTPGALTMRMAAKLASAKYDFVEGFTWFLVWTFALFPAFFVVLPTEERLNNSRQLQMNTGLHPLTYWTMYLLWDLFTVLIVASIMIFVAFILEDYKLFSSYGGLGAMFLIVVTYGFAIIPLAYLISSIPETIASAVIILILILFVPQRVILKLMDMDNGKSVGFFMNDIASLAGLRLSFGNMAVTLQKNARCNVLGKRERDIICSSSTVAPNLRALKSCCANFKPEPYLKWIEEKKAGYEVPGTGQLLVGMVVTSLVCLVLHVSLELGVGRFIRGLLSARGDKKAPDSLPTVFDEDVSAEEQRISEMIATKNTNSEALVMDTLRKRFGSFYAVSGLTFGVHHGECFGLLGINGAGKTTTFRMITGGELPSFGDAYQGRFTLKRNRRAFISQIGYCPQFDAFVPYLTGKENLQLFARLRGIPWKEVNMEADKLLESVGLTESGNDQCRKYSGGMKRRLSAAIALIGNPPLVLLDEPTSGVDPVSRRQFWKVVEAVKGSGQSIILTSHSMDECEALCTRLSIMVNGRLQCIGGVQHLKHRFAQGFSLTLKLKTGKDKNSEQQENEVESLSNQILLKFRPCVIKDQHKTVIQYNTKNTSLDWNEVFNNLEELKKSYGDIVEDYSVSEASLEEVFLTFARRQHEPRGKEASICGRMWNCFRKQFAMKKFFRTS